MYVVTLYASQQAMKEKLSPHFAEGKNRDTKMWGSPHNLHKFWKLWQLHKFQSGSRPCPSAPHLPSLPGTGTAALPGAPVRMQGQGQEKCLKKAKNLLHCLKFGVTYVLHFVRTCSHFFFVI